MSSLQRAVAAIRRPLMEAARDGFRALQDPSRFAAELRRACAGLTASPEDGPASALAAWSAGVAAFEALELDQQMAEVARGLRLCRMLEGPAPTDRAVGGEGVGALDRSTDALPGIGPALAGRLADRGLWTVGDLLWFVPRRYDDARRPRPVDELLDAGADGDHVTVCGLSQSVRFVRRGRRGWIDLRLAGASGRVVVVRWFNAHAGMCRRLEAGTELILCGRVRVRDGSVEMANPDLLSGAGDAAPGGGILCRYGEIPGLPAAVLRKACRAAAERALADVTSVVPPWLEQRRGLVGLADALRCLHSPPGDLTAEQLEELNLGRSTWHRRLAYEDLFTLGLVVARRRAEYRSCESLASPAVPIDGIAAALPFELTSAQRRAIAAVSADLAADVPMNRLLQGDVGSGKTAVAFAAAYQVVASGRQVALMAPTELLAEQHLATLRPWCDALGVRVALLTASTPRPVRASMLGLLAAGRIDVLIGTHALLASSVAFAELGLVIIDEQHRFGVAQRARLRRQEGGPMPHLLVMTATPIPRTLALTAYGELDVSTIDELPAGREPPRTQVLRGLRGREGAYRALTRRLERGERAFVVCPLVEPLDPEPVGRVVADATSVAGELTGRLAPHRIGLVHGRLPADERDRVMDLFRRGDIRVLVATTVVEVGVDIPEAVIMIIEDADSFGLAQLHQLRGRVGRRGGASECVLLTRGPRTEEGQRRLEVMAATSDGFEIAEEDLRLRGPGELIGLRQAGTPRLRFGDVRDYGELLARARSDADELVRDDPDLARPEHRPARLELERLARERDSYGPESG